MFSRLLIPMVVGGLWYYAHLQRQTMDKMTATWQEGGVTVTGNPFKMPGRPVIVHASDDANSGATVTATSDTHASTDAGELR